MRKALLAVLALSVLTAACGDGNATRSTATPSTSSSTTSTTSTSTSTSIGETPTSTGQPAPTTTAAPRRTTTTVRAAAVPSTTSTTADPAFPATVKDSNGASVVVKARPKRVVSLSPTATETLFAVGAGSQVVAVDSNSNYPAEAPKTNLSGFKPNSEAILKYEPDLVVLARGAQDVIDDLKRAGVTVLFESAALDFADAENQFRDLGTATGHAPAGQALAAKVRQELADIAASTPKPARQVSLYWELSTTYFSATSKTFIGKVLSTLGTTNIADGASGKVDDYPQLSSEYIVSSDPDLILLADTKGAKQSAETVGARSGWSQMTAVKNGDIVGLDDDIASRWGPRLPELLRAVAAAVQKVAARR